MEGTRPLDRAAGALWFVTGRRDVVAQEAVEAWREQHGDAAAQWRTIPAPLRQAFSSERHVITLEAEAREADRARIQRYQRKQRGPSPDGSGVGERLWDILIPTCLIVATLSLIALMGIGLLTVWGWIAS